MTPAAGGRRNRAEAIRRILRKRARGQVLVFSFIVIILFMLVAIVLIDVYHIQEARNWGYQVAQEAAMEGVGKNRDFSLYAPTAASTPTIDILVTSDPLATEIPPACEDIGLVTIDATQAEADTRNAIAREMARRGIATYTADVRVISDPHGGSVAGFPPSGRLNGLTGDWTTTSPAVGVYLSFDVSTFFMSFIGRDSVTVNVFAAAALTQPPVCPNP
jgi:hypothetical protein